MCAPVAAGSDDTGPRLRVAEIFRRFGPAYRASHALSPQEARVLAALSSCRTAALGGHLEYCAECGFARPVYNSCRDRHCPSCQAYAQREWIEQRQARILPVGHFHVVFTLPSELRSLARADPAAVYEALFTAASQTLLELGRSRLGLDLGITMVLHTWTRELLLHPHVHCVVTAGGQTADGTWKSKRRFLLPIGALRKLFRGVMRSELLRAFAAGRLRVPDEVAGVDGLRRLLRSVYRKRWVVYCKAPFAGAEHVFAYLGRYTHRVGISDQRLVEIGEDAVRFRTRGAATISLPPYEFLRRFLLHVLPPRFHKIRHYGLYASTHVANGRLDRLRAQLPTTSPPPTTESTATPSPTPPTCPRCGTPLVRLSLTIAPLAGVVLLWPNRHLDPDDTS